MDSPKIFVSVLTHNSQRWVKNCLDSLIQSSFKDFQTIVVDNASSDHTNEIVENGYPQIQLIKNKKNSGYAEGNNIAIRYALAHGAEYVVILNDDIVVDKLWLSELVLVANNYPQFEILAPMQYDYQGKNIDPLFLKILNQSSKFRDDFKNNSELDKIYEVPCTFGAVVFFKRTVLEKVGLFDPLYFLYSEEVDFFQRAQFYGIKTAVVTTGKVNHWHSAVQPKKGSALLKFVYLSTRNKHMAILKDPRNLLLKNMAEYYICTLKYIFKKPLSIKVFFRLFLSLIIHLWILVHFPLIIYKRFHEKRSPCYL
jgi:GT2 family glycosyltransferase